MANQLEKVLVTDFRQWKLYLASLLLPVYLQLWSKNHQPCWGEMLGLTNLTYCWSCSNVWLCTESSVMPLLLCGSVFSAWSFWSALLLVFFWSSWPFMAPLPIPFWWSSRWSIVPLIEVLLSLRLFPLPLSFGSGGDELITSFCTPSKTSLTCIKLDAPGYNRPKHNTRKGHPTYKTFKTGSIQIVADYRITGEETLSYVVYPKPLA